MRHTQSVSRVELSGVLRRSAAILAEAYGREMQACLRTANLSHLVLLTFCSLYNKPLGEAKPSSGHFARRQTNTMPRWAPKKTLERRKSTRPRKELKLQGKKTTRVVQKKRVLMANKIYRKRLDRLLLMRNTSMNGWKQRMSESLFSHPATAVLNLRSKKGPSPSASANPCLHPKRRNPMLKIKRKVLVLALKASLIKKSPTRAKIKASNARLTRHRTMKRPPPSWLY